MMRPLILGLLLVMLAVPVYANVQYVAMENCSLSTGSLSLACGNVVTASCRVTSTFESDPGPEVLYVTFTLTHYLPEGTTTDEIITLSAPVSGNRTNGLWAKTFAVNDTTGNISFSQVWAQVAGDIEATGQCKVGSGSLSWVNWLTMGAQTLMLQLSSGNDTWCYGRWGQNLTAGSQCTCQDVTIAGVCQSTNTRTVVISNPCTGTSYTTTAACDFCDPQWTPFYTTCDTNFSAGDPLIGYATKDYYKANSACTTSQDNVKPVDAGTNVTCRLDLWGSFGRGDEQAAVTRTVLSSEFVGGNVTLSSKLGSYAGTYGLHLGENVSDDALRPIVFDVDRDGETEIVVAKNNPAEVMFFSSSLGSAGTTITTAREEWQGPLAIWGIETVAEETVATPLSNWLTWYVDSEIQNNASIGFGIAGIATETSTGDEYFVSYRFESGAWVQKAMVNLQTATGDDFETNGVVCSNSTCYMASLQNYFYGIDAKDGSVDVTVNMNAPGAATATNGMNVVPALVSVTSGALPVGALVEGTDGTYPGVFYCPLSGAACDWQPAYSPASGLGINVSVGGLSRIVVSAPNASNKVRVQFTAEEEYGGDVRLLLYDLDVSAAGIIGQGVKDVAAIIRDVQGDTPVCISSPARMECINGDAGVGFSATYEAGSATVTELSMPAVYLGEVDSPSSPFSDYNDVGLPGVLGPTFTAAKPWFGDCIGDTCILLSGPATNGTKTMYISRSGGPYTTISLPSGMFNGSAYHASVYMYGAGPYAGLMLTDMVVGHGVLDSKFFIVLQKIVGTNDSGYSGTFELWTLDPVVGGWTLKQTLSAGSAFALNGSYVPGMMRSECGDDGCLFTKARYRSTYLAQNKSLIEGIYVDQDLGMKVVDAGFSSWGGYPASDWVLLGYAEDFSGAYYHVGRSGASDERILFDSGTLYELESWSQGFMSGPYRGTDGIYWWRGEGTLGGGSTGCYNTTTDNVNIGLAADQTLRYGYNVTDALCRQTIRKYDGGLPTAHYVWELKRNAANSLNPAHLAGDASIEYYVFDTISGTDSSGRVYFAAPFDWPGFGGASKATFVFAEDVGMYLPVIYNSSVGTGIEFCEALIGACRSDTWITGTSAGYNVPGGDGVLPTWGSASFENTVYYPPGFDASDARLLTVGGGSVSYGGEYHTFECWNGKWGSLAQVSSVTESGDGCIDAVVVGDVDADEQDDMIAPTGIYGPYVKKYALGTNAAADALYMDLNSDKFGDVVLITPTIMKTFVSRPPISAATYGPQLAASGVACSFDGVVTMSGTMYGVESSLPSSLEYRGILWSGPVGAVFGTPISSYAAWSAWSKDNLFEARTTKTGNYTMKMQVRDVTGAVIEKECSKYVEPSIANITFGEETIWTACTLVPDGEFNVDGEIGAAQGWEVKASPPGSMVVRGNGNEAVVVGGTNAYSTMTHGIGKCINNQVTLEMRFNLTRDAPAQYAHIMLWAEYSDREVEIAGVQISRSGTTLRIAARGATALQTYTGQSHYAIVKVIIDRTNRSQTVYVDNVSVATLPFNNEVDIAAPLTGVVLRMVNGMVVDYVRISDEGAKVTEDYDKSKLGDLSLLDDCKKYSTDYSPKHNTSGNASVYARVARYCADVAMRKGYDDPKVCDKMDLLRAVRYNTECYEEAFAYCVNVAYPVRSGEWAYAEGDPEAEVMAYEPGLDGATVCSAVLAGGYGFDKTATPLLSFLWNDVILRNFTLIVVLIVAVVFIMLATKAYRESR